MVFLSLFLYSLHTLYSFSLVLCAPNYVYIHTYRFPCATFFLCIYVLLWSPSRNIRINMKSRFVYVRAFRIKNIKYPVRHSIRMYDVLQRRPVHNCMRIAFITSFNHIMLPFTPRRAQTNFKWNEQDLISCLFQFLYLNCTRSAWLCLALAQMVWFRFQRSAESKQGSIT